MLPRACILSGGEKQVNTQLSYILVWAVLEHEHGVLKHFTQANGFGSIKCSQKWHKSESKKTDNG